jgi:hypothetical protein
VTIGVENMDERRGLIVVVPIMAVIVVMMVIGVALVVVAARARRAHVDGDFRLRFRGKQSKEPQCGEDQ